MSIYYYHSFNLWKHFNTYEDCKQDLRRNLTIGDIEDYIISNYNESYLASKFINILFLNDKIRAIEEIDKFYDEIIDCIYEDWIFEEESDFEEGVCSTCSFSKSCSKSAPSVSNCSKWAWLSWNSKDPFAEEKKND